MIRYTFGITDHLHSMEQVQIPKILNGITSIKRSYSLIYLGIVIPCDDDFIHINEA